MMTDLASTTPQSLGRDPMVGLRLARVDGFEPAIALGQDELPAYLRRFTMLFADDATMRRGGIGRVTRAVNAQGEAVALKQLILPTRDEFDDDAAHEALVAKFKAAFREEYEEHILKKHCKAGVCSNLRTYKIDLEKCKGCSKCARNCPVNAITGKIKTPFVIDNEKCIKCGTCKDNCAFGAIYTE